MKKYGYVKMKRFLVLSLAGCCGPTVEGTDWFDGIFGSDWFDGTVDTDGLFDLLFSSFGLLSGIKFGLVTARKL